MSTVGFFLWERGLRGPIPIKISLDRQPYLSEPEWIAKTLSPVHSLDAALWKLPLAELAKRFPMEEKNDGR